MPPADRRRGRPPDDEGTITILVIGFTFLALLVMLLAVNVSVVFLARRDLVSTADGAALAAAQEIDQSAFLESNVGVDPLLLDADASEAVAEQFEDGDVRVTDVTVEGDTVTVVVERDVDLPLGGLVGLSTWHVEAVATARNTVR